MYAPLPKSPIEEYRCGIMVKSEDTKGIIEAIKTIRNMSYEELAEMEEREKKLAMDKYSYEVLAKKFEQIFD